MTGPISPGSPGDFPANPIDKPGYILDFHDEFDGPDLDPRRWVPYYLPHWSSRARSAPNYRFENGCLVLQITGGQQPWCPEFDGAVKCSSIQTGEFAGPVGSPVGQHRFNPACAVREAQENVRTYTPQYGYFEVRARAVRSQTNHAAVWMIGYEDAPERSGEINICEIMGADISPQSSRIGHGVRKWGDSRLRDEFHDPPVEIDTEHFHIYALEWLPDRLDFYVDNRKIRTLDQSPDYPMQFMLGVYERPSPGGEPDGPYPKNFSIDYFRAYQPVKPYSG